MWSGWSLCLHVILLFLHHHIKIVSCVVTLECYSLSRTVCSWFIHTILVYTINEHVTVCLCLTVSLFFTGRVQPSQRKSVYSVTCVHNTLYSATPPLPAVLIVPGVSFPVELLCLQLSFVSACMMGVHAL